ncbi:MAG: tRNA (adenosine(37)-N6)-threonylcarbamoyltransferase complex dimerization subunit type 1 TsaB [Bradymonadales bacterium]|jgi:tRNA threonylcarbamoyladenosine biosynthesis protein TsaB
MQTSTKYHPDNLVLSVDSSSPVQSVAIVRGKEILCDFSVKPSNREGPSLLSLIDYALKHCSLRIHDVERFVVCRGPGAFTSLRVSMALLKSFALSLDRPLYAASSLDALAARLPYCSKLLCSCIDARRGELYVAFYRSEGASLKSVSQELLLSPKALCEYAVKHYPNEEILFIGSGADARRREIEAMLGTNALWHERSFAPSAVNMALEILKTYPQDPPPIALESLEPTYVRVESFVLAKPFFATK